MARNLYRFYLYAVFIAMLSFATIGLATFLQTLFALTALRGSYSSVPSSATLIQTGVFFGVSCCIAAIIGGLHYWLIRRDMRGDPATGGSNAIRSFFLNITELIIAPIAVGVGASVIGQLGQGLISDVSFGLAATIAMLVLLGVLEWERRRAQAGTTVALLFQRLNRYGVQFILLNVLIAYATFALNELVDALFFGGAVYHNSYCGSFTPGCQVPNALVSLAAALWVALFWLVYGFAGRKDVSLLQRVAYYISFAYGAGFMLYGIGQAIALVVLKIGGESVTASDVVLTYNFVASLILGLLIVVVYRQWLRSSTRQQPVPSAAWQTALSIVEAIVSGLMALAFYGGAALVLLNIFEPHVNTYTWANSLALLITGVGYGAFDIHLYRRKERDVPGAKDARRGFVFVLLGGGVLATTIGGAFALYAVISAALGSPLDNWQHLARSGASAVAVGIVILAVYLVLANREKLFSRSSKSVVRHIAQPAAPQDNPPLAVQPPLSPSIEEILDELLSGKLNRDEAASRIRELAESKQ